jgi:hypothetical protein
MEASCRLEGLLETIESRGKDLQKTLDENRLIENSLKKQIENALREEPLHPVISELPQMDDLMLTNSMDGRSDSPRPALTPTDSGSILHTPEGTPPQRQGGACYSAPIPSESNQALDYSGSSFFGLATPRFPVSPSSLGNADNHRNGLLGYRRAASEDDLDNIAFGCGVAFLGSGSSTLFGRAEANQQSLLPDSEARSIGGESRARANSVASHDASYHPSIHAAPTLTSSFDGIDFRTGMSGHRGLTNAKAGSPSHPHYHHHQPAQRGRVRMMSVHSGISRVRSSGRNQHSPPSASSSSSLHHG